MNNKLLVKNSRLASDLTEAALICGSLWYFYSIKLSTEWKQDSSLAWTPPTLLAPTPNHCYPCVEHSAGILNVKQNRKKRKRVVVAAEDYNKIWRLVDFQCGWPFCFIRKSLSSKELLITELLIFCLMNYWTRKKCTKMIKGCFYICTYKQSSRKD